MVFAFAQEMIFKLFEKRQDVAPCPARKSERAPAIVVRCLAAHADHGVDRRGSADDFAAWVSERAAIEARLALGPKHPVRAWIADGEQVSRWDVEPNPIVRAASLEKHNPTSGISG